MIIETTPANENSASAKKELRKTEAQAAWKDYQSDKAAVDKNTARLRALRLAREAAAAKTDAPKVAPLAAARPRRLRSGGGRA